MEKEQQIEIQLDENTADGIYSNMVVINHSNTEFIVDFLSMLPGLPKAKVRSRIILTPQHAKSFLKALSENIQRYEKHQGPIDDKSQQFGIPINFGVTGEA